MIVKQCCVGRDRRAIETFWQWAQLQVQCENLNKVECDGAGSPAPIPVYVPQTYIPHIHKYTHRRINENQFTYAHKY